MEATTETKWAEGKPAELNPEAIAKLKEDQSIDLVIEVNVKGKKAWFKNVDMKTNAAAKAQKTGDGYYNTIAKNCFIGGDPDLINDPKLFHHTKTQLDDLVYWLPVEVKKY
jgi:hypothetical protein